jgi:hypothetical protein
MLRNQSRNNCKKRKERTRKEKDIQEEEEKMLAVRRSTHERWKGQGRWVGLGWARLTWFVITWGAASD